MADAGSANAGRTRLSAVRAWVAWWLLLGALWLLLVDLVAAPELLAGVAAVTIAATGAVVVRRQRRHLLKPRPRWLLAILTSAPPLIGDLVPLARALWRRGVLRREEEGGIVEVPYGAVGDTDREAAHRALTEALGSLGPNTIVVEIVRERRVLRAHQLVPKADVGRAARPVGEDA